MDLNEKGNRVKDGNDVDNLNGCNLPSQDGYLTMQDIVLRDNIHIGLDKNIQVRITSQVKSNQMTLIFNVAFRLHFAVITDKKRFCFQRYICG